MKQIVSTLALVLVLSFPADALETIRYFDKEGNVVTAELITVTKATEKEFRARIRRGGRNRPLRLEPRQILELRRGDRDAINQWSKSLALGKGMMAAGQIANQGTASGAEETFAKAAYSTERGTRGQEATERAEPWQNMYGAFYLIEARLALGKQGKKDKLNEALEAIAQFRKRSSARAGAKLDMSVPDYKGGSRESRVFGFGANRLGPHVDLLEARTFAALGQADKAKSAYDKIISDAPTKGYPPNLIVAAVIERTNIEASGKEAQEQETIYRSAGTTLRGLAGRQPDAFGKEKLTLAANKAMLQGADLLFEAAKAGKYGINVPLNRYKQLGDSTEARKDEALRLGAKAGIGMCLVEEGKQGELAYTTLLEVVTDGYRYPEQVARALYYLAKAAPLYGKEIDGAGGSGVFLREEGDRWKKDLQERFPSSKWAKKAKSE
ncbi:MAG: hypothetical protein AAGD14_02920 [Planctomycetota bacterium]